MLAFKLYENHRPWKVTDNQYGRLS